MYHILTACEGNIYGPNCGEIGGSQVMNAHIFSGETNNFTGLLVCHSWLQSYNWNNDTDIYDINAVVRLENIGGICLLAVVMVMGTIGNVPVLYIYGRKFKKSAYRFNVLMLASTNYVTSCVLIPGSILFLSNPLLEFSPFICKAGVLLFPFFAVLAGSVLLMIAIDRYLATCRPEGQQLTTRIRITLFFVGVSFALLLSWPMIFIFQNDIVETGINGIKARTCGTVKDYTHYLAILNGIWTTFSLMNAVLLIILYTLIIRKIMESRKLFRAIEATRRSNVLNKTIQKRKTTVTLFIVTAVALVANLPSNIIGILLNSRDHKDCGLSLGATIVLRMFIWIRLVSPAINPFLYGFSDHRFQRELRNLFCIRANKHKTISVSSISQTF